MTQKKRLFSGIQPTGNLHLGNYLGAVQQFKTLQQTHDALFCIVDLHAITIDQDPEQLRAHIIDLTRIYLAAGLDPTRAIIFVQSDVSAHSELMWILNCTVARMGDMEKMTQFKDKATANGAQRASVGLFDYPVLMAADILLYDTQIVPVGEDQVQHVELTRTLAKRFNKKFGETFIIPTAKVRTHGKRIMGLDDPTKKMSKSAPSTYNYIALTDDAETIQKKVRKAVTDGGTDITYSDERPALKNLLDIYHSLSGEEIAEIVARYDGKGFGAFKAGLSDVIVAFLAPLQQKMAEISDDDVLRVLHDGARRAQVIAKEKLTTVQSKIGLIK